MRRRNFTITKVERVTGRVGKKSREHWQAHVTYEGHTYIVHDRYGAWMRDIEHDRQREIPLEWQDALSERVGRKTRSPLRVTVDSP